jgi:hypothetical protein
MNRWKAIRRLAGNLADEAREHIAPRGRSG